MSRTSPADRIISWGLDHGWPELRLDVCRTIQPSMSAYAAFAKRASPEDMALALAAIEEYDHARV
ncbi:MAG: hypothetical protein HYY01_00675 [Chloroflexi bacterium]|nr:hypothetical protein [Chloroflexota bacterium]